MENLPSSAPAAINRGAVAFQEGRLDDARTLFVHALHLDPDSEPGWLWLATVSEDPAEQRYCLNRALEVNPESTGLARLARLPDGPATLPDELLDLKPPPLPPDLAQVGGVPMPLLPRSAVQRRQRARAVRPSRGQPPEAAPEMAERPATFAPGWPGWLRAAVVLVLLLAVIAAIVLMRMVGGPGGASYSIAYVGPLSGPDAQVGEQEARAVELVVRNLNDAGGIGGRRLAVIRYDDQNDPALAAERAREIVANQQVLLVIGHDRSEASLAAAPIYEEAGLAAISPSSTADRLTEGDPWYFRTIFTNHQQGELVAAYTQHALQYDRASVVSTANAYESSLASAFIDSFEREGTIVAEWTIDPANPDASITALVEEFTATDDPGILMLALQPEEARLLLLALGRAGLHPPMIGGDAIGYEDFANLFANEPEEMAEQGFFTDTLYVASPLIYDSLGGDALGFAHRFRDLYGSSPEWFGAKAYDAATLAAHAIGALHAAEPRPEGIAAQRQQVRDALAATNSLEASVQGLSGPLYFDANNSVPQALSFGQFDLGSLLTAPIQYRAVQDPAEFDLAADQAAGLTFELDGQLYRQYRVAYVGVDINEVSGLDPRAETFDADFFLWFRYSGDQAVENVFFPNSTNPEGALPTPMDQTEVNGDRFAMYRIHDTFTDPLDFEDYPWDRHLLTITMQNRTMSQNDIVYVPDQANIRQSQADRLRSGADFTKPFSRIPNWIADSLYYAQDSATVRSSTPDPRTGAPDYEQFSTYAVEMSYGRDVRAFLIKNMLPLALLALVTYISLYFPPANAATRITFSITSVLTSSVMLQTVSNSLPNVGYTVAIEWLYYVYIGLSAILVLVNITVDRWYKAKRFAAVRQLDRIARVFYPAVLLIVILTYAIRFG